MNLSRTARGLLLATLGLCASAGAAERTLDRATMQHLSALRGSEALRVDAFPVGPEHTAALRFERVQIYAKDAPLYLVTAGGKQELPRSNRIFLRARSDDGATRVAMSLNADGSFAEGNGVGPDGAFAVDGHADASGAHVFSARTLQSTLPSPDAFEFKCGNESVQLDLRSVTRSADLATQLRDATSATGAPATTTATSSTIAAPQATQAFRTAVIAIDTDSLFMSRLFSNNTTSATNWIASMFNTMNTMYETDLNVQLLIGTTILRTSAVGDPYTALSTGSANGTDLNIFGNYWRLNESAVPRSFAILLSGAIASSGGSCSAAGIAWIDEYCQKGFVNGSNTVGSYSVNKVCTSLTIDPNGTFDARIVGHEIGHNFGANHTHCTNVSTGSAPTGSNTIDQCYNGESGSGCYAGATSCPSGQSSGTIMSYCNISGCGTQNQLHFHPTHINSVLLPAIAANTPSCLGSGNDIIFQSNFGG